MDSRMYSLSEEVGRRLRERGCTLATAESSTGGWVAQAITAVPGASAYFQSGFVTYSNLAKQKHLAVPSCCFEGPEAPGAVSEKTVLAMARGALTEGGADVAVANSGIAGPDGGSEDKPVGTVWIGWAIRPRNEPTPRTQARVFHFQGDREEVRRQSVIAALEGLLELIDNQE